MQFISYQPTKREEWDQFVLLNPQSGFGHLSSQFLLTEENTHVINRSIMMYQDATHLVAVLPLYEIKSRSLRVIPVRTLSSVAGPLLRPTQTASEQKTLVDSLVEHVKSLANELGVDRIAITYPSFIGGQLAIDRFRFFPLRKYGFVENNALGTYIDLRRDDAEILASLEKNCRYKIRKAEKEGVQISAIVNREDWLRCESLNKQTLGNLKHSRRTMETVWDEFIANGHAYAFAAKHEAGVVAVEVIQTFHQCAYAWIAYNARPIFAGANNYLLWRAILHAKQVGMSFFLMGTYDFSEDAKTKGISDFKRSYGGTPYYILGGTFLRKRRKHHAIILSADIVRGIGQIFKKFGRRLKERQVKASSDPAGSAE